jgi:CheY-like chemotaxis protein
MQLKDATILVVDDEIGLLSIFKKWFEREGCRVLTAENGVEALELLKSTAVDTIISDVRMPKMDGVELAKCVKKTHKYDPKIIFISGFAEIDERECYDLGIELNLPKPVLRTTLVSAVRTCLTDRDELWRHPPSAVPQRTFKAVFESLLAAQDQGLIAFGHGGICVRSPLAVTSGEAIGLNLQFSTDYRALTGQGIVRWAVRHEEQIGIEITYVDDSNRAWIVGLAERDGVASFIPRSSDTGKV